MFFYKPQKQFGGYFLLEKQKANVADTALMEL